MSLWTMRLRGSMLCQVHGGVCAVCCAAHPDYSRRPKHVGAILI